MIGRGQWHSSQIRIYHTMPPRKLSPTLHVLYPSSICHSQWCFFVKIDSLEAVLTKWKGWAIMTMCPHLLILCLLWSHNPPFRSSILWLKQFFPCPCWTITFPSILLELFSPWFALGEHPDLQATAMSPHHLFCAYV